MSEIIRGSGNVFADLGMPEPELRLAKAKLAAAIANAIDEAHLTQVEAAQKTGLDQPRISAITRGQLDGFTIDRLFRTLNALGQQIDVIVHLPSDGAEAHLTVSVER